jgi:potassium channel subfamily K, other eukaryote
MIQTLMFVFVIGVSGLLFSKIENTTYVDGIYWMVTTTLLIGFGDITPHTAIMKVLAFPLIIIGVVLLAFIVTSIVQIVSDRARRRKLELKQRLKRKLSEQKRLHAIRKFRLNPWRTREDIEELKLRRSLTLQEELEKLRKDDKRRERRANLRNMAIGFCVFLVFWLVGALIFHLVEVLPFYSEADPPAVGIWQCPLLLLCVHSLSRELIIDFS